MRIIPGAISCGSAALLLALGCSSSDEEGDGSNGGGDGTGDDGDGTGDGIFFTDDGTDGGAGVSLGEDNFNECAAETVATETVPLDIYVMFDQSCSMSCPPELVGPGQCCLGDPRPRMDQVRAAVTDFLQSPDSAGIGVGIGYFGYFPSGQTSCDPGDYSNAAVEIGALPNNAGALIQSLNSISPVGETPTDAAITGACDYAKQWKGANPSHAVVILLVTDGVPEAPVSFGCNPSIQSATAAAQACATEPPQIPTYVLGVGGNVGNMDQLAQAGGTGQPYLVDASTDVTGAVLAALNEIRDAAAVPCDFQIPPPPSGEELDPTKVNVTYQTPGGETAIIPKVVVEGDCGDEGGWYYDNGDNPTAVRLCSSTCNRVTAGLIAGNITGRTATLDLKYGCGTVAITR